MIIDGNSEYCYCKDIEIYQSNDIYLKEKLEDFLSKYMLSDFNSFINFRKKEVQHFKKNNSYKKLSFLKFANTFLKSHSFDSVNYQNLKIILEQCYGINYNKSRKIDLISETIDYNNKQLSGNLILKQQLEYKHISDYFFNIKENNNDKLFFTLDHTTFMLIKKTFKNYIEILLKEENEKKFKSNKNKYIDNNLINNF